MKKHLKGCFTALAALQTHITFATTDTLQLLDGNFHPSQLLSRLIIISCYGLAIISFCFATWLLIKFLKSKQHRKAWPPITLFIFCVLMMITPSVLGLEFFPTLFDKPVIYLYPETEQTITVKLDIPGLLHVTYPRYQDGWHVIAKPDGQLINITDNRRYSYLFWEGQAYKKTDYDLSTGFVVKNEDTLTFLQRSLEQLGLTPKELNEFIVYWLPQMIKNKYNLIHFATKAEYDDKIALDISPKPDSILRVFMVYKGLNSMLSIHEQTLPSFVRHGFTVVEWGGARLP